MLIWKEPVHVTSESADFAAVDGSRDYSSLEGADAYGSQPMVPLPMGGGGCRFGRRWRIGSRDRQVILLLTGILLPGVMARFVQIPVESWLSSVYL